MNLSTSAAPVGWSDQMALVTADRDLNTSARYGVLAVALFTSMMFPLVWVLGSAPLGTSPPRIASLALFLVGTVGAYRVAQIVGARRPHYLHLAFGIFCYVFLAVAGLMQVTRDRFPLDNSTYSDEGITAAAAVALMGVVGHEVGYRLASHPRVPTPGRATVHVARSAVVLLGLAGLAFVGYTLLRSGVGPFFSSREAAAGVAFGDSAGGPAYRQAGKASGLLAASLLHSPVFISAYILIYQLRSGIWTFSSPATRLGITTLGAALLIANLIVNNPVSNSRLWSGVVLLSLISLVVNLRRARTLAFLAVAYVASFLLIFPNADAFRRENGALSFETPEQTLLSDGSFSAFQTVITGDRYLQAADHTYGTQLLGALLSPVPRSLWPGKPIDTGALIDSRFNRAATFWTEMQVDFGLVGVVCGLGLLGWFAARLDQTYEAALNLGVNMLVPIIAPFYIFLLRGSLTSAIGVLLSLVAVLLVTLRWRHTQERVTTL